MKRLAILLFCVVLFNCSNDVENFIPHLEGYWEIEKATLPSGIEKVYTFSDTIDYFEVTDSLVGFRKKLKPTFNGTFETSNDAESFQIKIEHDSLNLYYKTAFDSWEETVLLATKDQLKIINKNKAVFLYKRYQPLNLD